MSKFVSRDRVAVTIDGANVIYIRSKMPVGVRNKVQDALIRVGSIDMGAQQIENVSVNVGEQNSVLLVNNILAWEGLEFRDEATGMPVPCIPENILNLDPDDPLVDKVLSEINRLNTKQEPIPNLKASGTTDLAPQPPQQPSESPSDAGTSILPSPIDTTGPLPK